MIVGFLLTAACMGVMALAAWLAGRATLQCPRSFTGNDRVTPSPRRQSAATSAINQSDIETVTRRRTGYRQQR